MMSYKKLHILLLLAGIMLTILLFRLTKVNSISSALLINFIMIPVLCLQLLVIAISFFSKNQKLLFIIDLILLCIIFYWFVDYIFIKG